MAETSNSRHIVPVLRNTVKEEIEAQLNKLPVQVGDFTAAFGLDAEYTDVEKTFGLILGHMRAVNVISRFRLGALWAQLHQPEYKAIRLQWQTIQRSRMTEDAYARLIKMLKQCKWVCGKWPVSQRSTAHSWEFFVREDPNKEKRPPRVQKAVFLEKGGCRQLEGVTYRESFDQYGRLYLTPEDGTDKPQ